MQTNMHLRGLGQHLMRALKEKALSQKISMNKLILGLLQEAMGLHAQYKHKTYHDLDKLAGTWSPQDAEEFLRNTETFEQIDEELWK